MAISLAELHEEQQRFQYHDKICTERSRTIDEISGIIGFFLLDPDYPKGSTGIKALLERYIAEKGHVVWADFGCGNALALRQGKEHIDQKGIGLEKIRTYGVDILPVVEQELTETIDFLRGKRDEIPVRVLDDKYAPVFMKDDITTVVLPERPDIVTCCEVLMWAYDPLMVFANAASQANIGATLGFSRINHMVHRNRFDTIGHQGDLFYYMQGENRGLPGFHIYDYFSLGMSELLLRKTSEQDFTHGFRKFDQSNARQGITHVYVKK